MGHDHTEETTEMATTTRKAHTLKGGDRIVLYGLTYDVCDIYAADGLRTTLRTTNPSMGDTGGFYRLPITRTITVGNNVDVEVV